MRVALMVLAVFSYAISLGLASAAIERELERQPRYMSDIGSAICFIIGTASAYWAWVRI